jgi:hypothetical protein
MESKVAALLMSTSDTARVRLAGQGIKFQNGIEVIKMPAHRAA